MPCPGARRRASPALWRRLNRPDLALGNGDRVQARGTSTGELEHPHDSRERANHWELGGADVHRGSACARDSRPSLSVRSSRAFRPRVNTPSTTCGRPATNRTAPMRPRPAARACAAQPVSRQRALTRASDCLFSTLDPAASIVANGRLLGTSTDSAARGGQPGAPSALIVRRLHGPDPERIGHPLRGSPPGRERESTCGGAPPESVWSSTPPVSGRPRLRARLGSTIHVGLPSRPLTRQRPHSAHGGFEMHLAHARHDHAARGLVGLDAKTGCT